MRTAKISENGREQTIHLSEEFRFEEDEVVVRKVGKALLLIPRNDLWETFLNGLNGFSPDIFSDDRYTEMN